MEFWIPTVVIYPQLAAQLPAAACWLVSGRELEG